MAFTIMYVYTEGEAGMGLELGKKIRQLRKFSGMTQEQLAEKLHVSRQALSKWENDTSLPDLESVIKISRLFQISLEELLLEEKHVEENRIQETQITLEDLIQINANSRRMNLLLSSGILLMTIGIMMGAFIYALRSTMSSMGYTLYRYIVTGQYAAAPVNYFRLLLPAVGVGIVGMTLCIFYFVHKRKH